MHNCSSYLFTISKETIKNQHGISLVNTLLISNLQCVLSAFIQSAMMCLQKLCYSMHGVNIEYEYIIRIYSMNIKYVNSMNVISDM